jgi:DNA polymerase III epsilon subunit-like protein
LAIADKVQADLDDACIAAHNAHIDYGVLARHLPTWKPAGVLDTLRLARAVLPSLPKHGLDALITHTGIDMSGVPGQRHRAAFDAHATALLLLNLAASFATWDDLVAAAVPPRLPGVPTPAPDTEEPTLW